MTDPSLPPESRAAEDNVARLIALAYRPDAPDPAFVRRIAERMDAEAARMRERPRVSVAPIAPAGDTSSAFVPSSMARVGWVCAGALMLVAGAVIALRGEPEHASPRDVGAAPSGQAAGARGGTTTVVTPLAPQEEPEPVPPKEPEPQPPEPDARMRAAMQKAAWLTENPVFKSHAFEIRVAEPYVVVQEYVPLTGGEAHKNPDRVATAKRLADRQTALLTELHREFRALFAERCRLPELKDEGRTLLAVSAWDGGSFRELWREANDGDAPYAFYTSGYVKGRLMLQHGPDARTGQDEGPAAHDRVQKVSDTTTMTVGTWQLLLEYRAIRAGRPAVPDATDIVPPMAPWFSRGLGEFLGTFEVERSHKDDLAGATFFHHRLSLERISQVRAGGRAANYREAAAKWTIPELLAPHHNGEVLTHSAQLYPSNTAYMMQLFDARAWGFVHFLWFYDEGRYRSGFLDFVDSALDGNDRPETLAKCLGRKDASDWASLEAEFKWYWDRCLKRQVGWRNPGSRSHPYDTETDPPKGRYDPDDPDGMKDPDDR